MRLLERDDILQRLEKLLASAREGDGRAVLVRGEAGIGKTSAIRSFTDSRAENTHILWGSCDDLLTARPLGPIWDMAPEVPSLSEALRGQDRHDVFTLVLELMARSLRPTIVVIEDLHWADEATIDLVKFLGRRVDRTHGLLVLTYRDDEVPGDRPLRVALADIPASVLERIALSPLSPAAVSQMALDAGGVSEGLWELTGGNPFFVTELLAADNESVPTSVREAVMGRIARLSSASRSVVDLVSVVPGRAELELIDAMIGPSKEAAIEAEAAGVLEMKGNTLAFRHELARRSVEADLPQIKRKEINLAVLRAVEELGYDVSRAAHHARIGGDVDALVRLAPLAARRAADMESHREAVAQLRALEPYLDRLDPEMRADHYDLWAYEELLGDEIRRAEEIIELGIASRRILGDPVKLGNSLLIGSRVASFRGCGEAALEMANEAASVLESVGGEELAIAFSSISQLAMLAHDEERTIWYGEKALAVAGEGPTRARANALSNMGTARMSVRYPEGLENVEESFAMSEELGFSYDQIRAAVNIGWWATHFRDLPTAELWIGRGLDLAVAREMPSFDAYVMSGLALIDEMRGRWAEAEARARIVLESLPDAHTAALVESILLRIRARRGEPDTETRLLDGWEQARQSDDLHRTAPASIALAEYVWIGGKLDQAIFPRLKEILADCLERESPWMAGELAYWLYLVGEIDQIPDVAPEPYRLCVTGDWKGAAAFWEQRAIPYDQAVALSKGSTEARIEALSIFDRLGARPVAALLRSELAAAGVSGVPRGPTRVTRENPLGLTPRQMDVLRHLAEGMTNSEIADRLFLSNRTVDHHVSAILGKLGASTRLAAVTAARDADLLDR